MLAPTRAKAAPAKSAPALRPAYLAAQGRLYRAIVSLPGNLCPQDEPLHERIVFFDGPHEQAAERLEKLLAHAWHVDTLGWANDGAIYNVRPAFDLMDENASADEELRLFELSWGGSEGIGYADPARVDLLVAPLLKARLEAAMAKLPRSKAVAA